MSLQLESRCQLSEVASARLNSGPGLYKKKGPCCPSVTRGEDTSRAAPKGTCLLQILCNPEQVTAGKSPDTSTFI